MDIRAVREAFPDWILMGNVACNRLQDVDDEVRSLYRNATDGGDFQLKSGETRTVATKPSAFVA